MTQKLEIVGIQHLLGAPAEFSISTTIDYPEDLTGFFLAVSKGSWKFERRNGHYILTLSNQ